MVKLQNSRKIIKNIYEERKNKNKNYSLRAFARDLKIPLSSLLSFLNGKAGISKKRALEISEALKFSVKEKNYFIDLVESEFSRNKTNKNAAKIKIIKKQYEDKNDDLEKLFSEWYYLAILELCRINSFQTDNKYIAGYLGITEKQVTETIKLMLKIKMLKKTRNKNFKTNKNFIIKNNFSSKSRIAFNKAMILKAIEAVKQQNVEKREFISLTMSFNDNDITKAKHEIKSFINEFNKKYSKNKSINSLYALNTAFFNLCLS